MCLVEEKNAANKLGLGLGSAWNGDLVVTRYVVGLHLKSCVTKS
jgi:hypothetical protein